MNTLSPDNGNLPGKWACCDPAREFFSSVRMKILQRLVALTLLGAACALPVSAIAQDKPIAGADSSAGLSAGIVVVPAGLNINEVERSMLEAAIGRAWTIKSKEDGKVVIFLENGRWVSLLTLVYDTKEVRIHSNSTRNGKAALPEGWIKFIKQDLTKSLNTLAYLK